jgi:hypothetical protein
LANIRGISQPLGFTAKDDGCLRPAKTDIWKSGTLDRGGTLC